MASLCLAQRRDTTYVLPTANVYGLPDKSFLVGSTSHALDSSIRGNFLSQHLGETLSADFPIAFRNYGNGMISGISLRGTSPNHTAVLWNGININSFSLGQADFSILPVSATDDISVVSGGSSVLFGSGAIGGAVLLNTAMSGDTPVVNVSTEGGSFGKYFGTLQASLIHERWSLRSRVYHLQCENDFKINSRGVRQDDAAFRQDGFLQDVQYRLSENKRIEAHYWYHRSDREVQRNANAAPGTDPVTQVDENHRLSIHYESHSTYGYFSATGGYVHDNIIFEKLPGVVERWIGDLKYRKFLPYNIKAEVGTSINHINGKIIDYNGKANEDRYDLMLLLERDFGKRLAISFNMRQPYVTGFSTPLLPYLGASFRVIHHDNLTMTLRANASRNFRVPTLNDRYWQPGGSLNLLPESSYAAETGTTLTHKNFSFDITGFKQTVDQLIKWIGGSSGYHAVNVMQVKIKGLESRVSWNGNMDWWRVKVSATYQYVKSITTKAPTSDTHAIGKQLMYTPEHVASAYFQLGFRRYGLMAQAQYNSKRFTDTAADDNYALDPFAVVDVTLSKSFAYGRNRFLLRASLKNIFNVDYRLYERRALPGLNYNIQINYQLNQKAE